LESSYTQNYKQQHWRNRQYCWRCESRKLNSITEKLKMYRSHMWTV